MIWLLKTFISAEFWIGAIVAAFAIVVLVKVNVPLASGWVRAILGIKKK